MRDSVKYVTCSCCGAQYHPAEIFLPNCLLGRPQVVKDGCGRIVSCTGENADYRERYTCDYCNSPLDIQAKIDFKVSYNKKMDVRSPHTTRISHPQFTLREDD